MKMPDFSKTFEIHMNASYLAIGGVLVQDKQPIVLMSCTINDAEQRYTM